MIIGSLTLHTLSRERCRDPTSLKAFESFSEKKKAFLRSQLW
jgi:hypothetical protein